MCWRDWLIDAPAIVTEVGLAWYRLLFMVLLWCGAVGAVISILSLMVSLVLYFGFGIRWGW